MRIVSYSPSTQSDGNDEINIPETIEGKRVSCIGKSAFEGCKSASKIILPHNVWNIEDCAFKDTKALLDVHYQRVMTNIGDWAFSGCNIESEIFLICVKSMGVGAFSDCTTLTKIVLGATAIEEDGSYFYVEFMAVSSKTTGTWTVSDGKLILYDVAGMNCFGIDNDKLAFIDEESDNFRMIKRRNGDIFKLIQ